MSSLFGDFETELAPPDTLTACVEALDGLGWRVDSVEAQRAECGVTSGPGDGGAMIEVELTETRGGTDIRLIGSTTDGSTLDENDLGLVLDQASDAIGEQIDKIEPPEAAESSEPEPPDEGEEPGETEAEPTAVREATEPEQSQEDGEAAQPQEEEQPAEQEPERQEDEEQPQELPPAGWFPDPWDGERERYWDGENWTGHDRGPDGDAVEEPEPTGAETVEEPDPAGAAADNGEGQESRRWLPKQWQSVALAVLVFCVGGAVGAVASPNDTETVQRTTTIQGPPRVKTVTQTQTQTQTVKAPAPTQSSSGPTVAGAAASSPAPSGGTASNDCDPSYQPICLDPAVSDYDCAGGEGDGPKYVDGPVTVVGNDHWQLDETDNDGVGCE